MMNDLFSRRYCLRLAPLTLSVPRSLGAAPVADASEPDTFPTQPPALAREMVGVSHFNIKRVRELVDGRPSLAKAAWDWGFGDWETALGAASHMGNREIAEYLLLRGAHPTIFSAAMLGQLDVVKAFVAALPGIQRITGPHSISLLSHAAAGGADAKTVRSYLESLGDAGEAPGGSITEERMKTLLGSYVYGNGPTERIEITIARAQLAFTRMGTTTRNLRHTGSYTFHPVGAAAVRIRFDRTDKGMTLTVYDPELVLTALRSDSNESKRQ